MISRSELKLNMNFRSHYLIFLHIIIILNFDFASNASNLLSCAIIFSSTILIRLKYFIFDDIQSMITQSIICVLLHNLSFNDSSQLIDHRKTLQIFSDLAFIQFWITLLPYVRASNYNIQNFYIYNGLEFQIILLVPNFSAKQFCFRHN